MRYIDFVEKQNALAVHRRVEGAIEVEYHSGTSWGDNQHEAHFAIKDNLCPEQQAKVFSGKVFVKIAVSRGECKVGKV